MKTSLYFLFPRQQTKQKKERNNPSGQSLSLIKD